MNNQKEIWKDAVGHESHYQISNLGNCRRKETRVRCRGGATRFVCRRILKTHLSNSGYYMTRLSIHSNSVHLYIHRLVATAFIPNPENKRTVNHKNGIKTDNRICNLEWMTYSENHIHALEMGLRFRGEKHYNSKLKTDQVLKIRQLANQIGCTRLSKMFEVSPQNICDITARRTWKHI